MTRTLAAALALVGLVAVVQSFRLAAEQREHAETREAHAVQLSLLGDMARQAEADQRAEEQRRAAAAEEVIREAAEREAQARADAAAAGAVADRLRRQIAALTARGGAPSGGTATAPAGPPAGDPIGVLADVLERADRRAGILAEYADTARSAGLACERAYDSLRP